MRAWDEDIGFLSLWNGEVEMISHGAHQRPSLFYLLNHSEYNRIMRESPLFSFIFRQDKPYQSSLGDGQEGKRKREGGRKAGK